MNEVVEREPLRGVISWSVIVCLVIAAAPWLSGGQEPLGQMMSGFALLLGSLLLWRQPNVRRLRPGPLVWTYAALVGWALLSLVWSVNRYSSVEWVVGLVLAGVAFRLAYAVSGEPQGRQRLIWAYLGSAVVFAVYAWWMYVTGGYERLTGTFYWPNPAAAYLIPALFLSFEAWRQTRKWWYGALVALFGTTFVLTDSRAAGAVLALVGLFYIVNKAKNRWFWITFVFSIGAIGLLTFGSVWLRHELQPHAVAVAPGTRLTQLASTNTQSGSDRLKYAAAAMAIWSDHPIIGTGAGTYPDVHPRYQERVVSASTSAHNVYLQVLPELGIVGEWLLLWLVVVMIVGLGRSLWPDGARLPLVLGTVGLLVHFGLDIDAQYPALVLLVGILLGLVYEQRPSYRPLGWRLPVLTAIALAPLVSLYQSDAWFNRGKADQANGNYFTAADDLRRARAYGVYNPDVLSAEGINHYTLAQSGVAGERQQALALARAAEHQDRFDAQHYQLEGRVRQLGGDAAGAGAAFRQALKLDPYNHPEYAYDLALLEAQTGQPAAALSTAAAMLNQYTSAVVANRAADPELRGDLAQLAVLTGTIYLQQGDVNGAEAASRLANGYDAGNVRAQALARLVEQAKNQ